MSIQQGLYFPGPVAIQLPSIALSSSSTPLPCAPATQPSLKVKVTQLCPTLCDPMNYTVRRILQPKILEWVLFPFSKRSSQPGIKPKSPTLWADSLLAESQGKPKNTGVGSLSLLQQIWPTQESNQGLLHCRWILYQLSYQGSPDILGISICL